MSNKVIKEKELQGGMYMNGDYEKLSAIFNDILDCFIIPEYGDENSVSLIKYTIQTAFYYRAASYVTEVCEQEFDMGKERILDRFKIYVYEYDRWEKFVELAKSGKFTMGKMKFAVKRTITDGCHIFDKLLSGSMDKRKCTVYSPGHTFADVILAVNELPFDYYNPDAIFTDGDMLPAIIRSEINHRRGGAYLRLEDLIPLYYKYLETEDIALFEKLLYETPLCMEVHMVPII